MTQEKKVPEIRFKGFSGEWFERELGEITSKIGSGKTPKGGDSTYVLAGIPLIRSQNIYNNLVNLDNVAYILPQIHEDMKNSNVFKNDVLLNITGASIGRSAVYTSSNEANVNQHVCIIRLYEGYDSAFTQLHLTSSKGQQLIDNNQAGGAREGLNFQQIARMKFNFTQATEQTQIGSYFKKLDNLINQHQQKHDKLSSIKKAMLEKMFPKQRDTVPEIRFKGFSGEWVEIGLLDSIERIIDFRGRTPKKLGLDWSPSGYRALSALNVKQGYIDFSIDPHFGDQELYDKWMNGSELHQGQVLFTTEAPMGNVAQVPNADKYILSQRTIAFVVKQEVITEDFLAVLLRSFKVFRELSSLSSGGTAKGVSQKVLSNLYVFIPTDLDEQAAIGNYFQKLDALINQHQQQITKLNNIKQACLSKMFV